MIDPQDQPEEATWGLVMPFVICQSKGGPYDDESFVAGYQAGRIDTALAVASTVGANQASFMTLTTLVPQLELLGMHHGFSDIGAVAVEADPDGAWAAMPEWTTVTFRRPS